MKKKGGIFKSKNYSGIQCFYCCKRGYRASECNLKKRAEKIQAQMQNGKDGNEESSASQSTSNVGMAQVDTIGNIADVTALLCHTSLKASTIPPHSSS